MSANWAAVCTALDQTEAQQSTSARHLKNGQDTRLGILQLEQMEATWINLKVNNDYAFVDKRKGRYQNHMSFRGRGQKHSQISVTLRGKKLKKNKFIFSSNVTCILFRMIK